MNEISCSFPSYERNDFLSCFLDANLDLRNIRTLKIIDVCDKFNFRNYLLLLVLECVISIKNMSRENICDIIYIATHYGVINNNESIIFHGHILYNSTLIH